MNTQLSDTLFYAMNWQELREQLLSQWKCLSENDLDMAGSNYRRLALLLEKKCGIAAPIAENYLRNFDNFEAQMPTMLAAS